SQKVVVYAGVDPTASSLHVGHLLPLMNLLHFYLNGHHSIGVIGKATATVGDPSGRSTERDQIVSGHLKNSFDSLWSQMDKFFQSGKTYALSRGYSEENVGTNELVTNSDWLDGMGLIEFLATVGRHVRVSQMLSRESVKARMDSTQGINFAEFAYQLLQSYDFWHLYKSKNCRLQIGGNDQFGNITAGIDLISRLNNSRGVESTNKDDAAYGLTVPLLTTASGEKLGKSAGNAVWLDEKMTSPFVLYQYFVRLPDDVVEKHLKMFTLLSDDTISRTMQEQTKMPELRTAHTLLAKEVVTMIHGEKKALKAEVQTQILFPPSGKVELSVNTILEVFGGTDELIKLPRCEVDNMPVSKLLNTIGAVKTRNEANNLIKAGGVYVGPSNTKLTDFMEKVQKDWFLDSRIVLMRIGKGKFILIDTY
ncbi:putative tyrosyl-tRNA synthetase mitochondrial precursor, partial [Geopyxis carbonaria]